jgi:spermidine synthase
VKPWKNLDEEATADGTLVLRQRGERDFLLTVAGRVLMSSMLHRSEDMLAKLAVERLAESQAPRVLTAGLGLGFTLRALLEVLPARADVEVAELHACVVRWCRGPLAVINGGAADDRRVRVVLGDVMASISSGRRYDAIVLDLMEGPSRDRTAALARLYGPRALSRVREALSPGGVYAVWGEQDDPSFLDALMRAGFDARRVIVGKGGPRHVVYIAQPAVQRGGRIPRGRELAHGGDAAGGRDRSTARAETPARRPARRPPRRR